MTASRQSTRPGAVATYCWPESQRMWACAPGCTCGSAWTGTLRIPRVPCSCRSVVTSVSESLVSFGFTSNERRDDEHKKTSVAVFAGLRICAGIAGADQAHRNARRRHDLKLLSLRGETTPRAPVWRSKSRCQFDRWEGRCYAQRRRPDRSRSAPQSGLRQWCDRCGDGGNRARKNSEGCCRQSLVTGFAKSV